MVLRKDEIEKSLYEENQAISQGKLKEDSPLDLSNEFRILCEACRRGDLKVCQEQIMSGVNINARDRFDYTPLILVSDISCSINKLNTDCLFKRPVCVAIMKWYNYSSSPEPFVNETPFKANDVFTMP